ncbi:hypothetical protein [Mariniluteicoccus flavus]
MRRVFVAGAAAAALSTAAAVGIVTDRAGATTSACQRADNHVKVVTATRAVS